MCKSALSFLLLLALPAAAQRPDSSAAAEGSMIGNKETVAVGAHPTKHPDAQWFPGAGLGLFIHWGISSVRHLDASWPMITGWGLATKKLDSAERAMLLRERYYNINNDRPVLTPNEYWSMAKDFKAEHYDPDNWIRAAKEAGFTYAVLTTRHHEGFALWPSAYGNFNTKNYMGGKDLIKPFVEACRKHGLKVGFYYSPPDWYFDKDHMNFLFGSGARNNPEMPKLDADLNPRTQFPSESENAAHRKAYAQMIRGQLTELFTNYGKIDLVWFDGKPAIDDPAKVFTREEIRRLQPGIVINPRLHGDGDYKTFERNPPKKDPGNIWAEFCNPWTNSWANSETIPMRAPAFILGQYVTMRSWNVNYLLSVGPNADGRLPKQVYAGMEMFRGWIKQHAAAVQGTSELPPGEQASVPATANGARRFLFLIPAFRDGGMYEKDRLPATDTTVQFAVARAPKSLRLLHRPDKIAYTYNNGSLSVTVPASLRSALVDVIEIVVE
jgi:alpha-L-fucosidase